MTNDSLGALGVPEVHASSHTATGQAMFVSVLCCPMLLLPSVIVLAVCGPSDTSTCQHQLSTIVLLVQLQLCLLHVPFNHFLASTRGVASARHGHGYCKSSLTFAIIRHQCFPVIDLQRHCNGALQ